MLKILKKEKVSKKQMYKLEKCHQINKLQKKAAFKKRYQKLIIILLLDFIYIVFAYFYKYKYYALKAHIWIYYCRN